MEKEGRKDGYINLPSELVLTKEGISLLGSSSLSIIKMKNHKGILREGISSKCFNAQTLQKMVMNSYVEEVFVSAPELLGKRFEIISTNNLIVYAILYKKLTPSLSEKFFHSPVVKDFNRKNPKNSIVDLRHINMNALEQLMNTQKTKFDSMKEEIFRGAVDRIDLNSELSAEDKEVQKRSLDKFIAWIDKRIWYLYFIVCSTSLKDEMRDAFIDMITVYLKRTQIATHLSNLLMELVQNAEKAHLERIALRNKLTTEDKTDKFLRSREARENAVKIAEATHESLFLSWCMNPERNSIGQQYRIQISITNFGLIDESTRQRLSTKLNTDVEGISLGSFYGGNDGAEKLGAGLGLLYNSYLEDYCKAEGIKYHCNIFPEPKLEKTTVVLDISL